MAVHCREQAESAQVDFLCIAIFWGDLGRFRPNGLSLAEHVQLHIRDALRCDVCMHAKTQPGWGIRYLQFALAESPPSTQRVPDKFMTTPAAMQFMTERHAPSAVFYAILCHMSGSSRMDVARLVLQAVETLVAQVGRYFETNCLLPSHVVPCACMHAAKPCYHMLKKMDSGAAVATFDGVTEGVAHSRVDC